MGQLGIWQLVIIAAIVLLLFGRGRIAGLMGELAGGITSFKKGLKDEEKTEDANLEDHNEKVVDVKAEKTKVG